MTSAGGSVAERRVLVTGAGGFVGSQVVGALVAQGARVAALRSSSAAAIPQALAATAADVEVAVADLCDRAAVDAAVDQLKPELVVHLAGAAHVGASFDDPDASLRTNIEGTVNLVRALAGRYERFVYVGTSEIYGEVPVPFREDGPVNPVSPYAVSKYAAERYCRMFQQAQGWPIVCVRPFNAYGPGQQPDRFIPQVILAALRGTPLLLTEGRQTREFTYIDDLARGIASAVSTPGIEGEVINLGSGHDLALRDVATRILALMGDPVRPQFGAVPYRPREVWQVRADPGKAHRLLGWKPEVSLDAGLAQTIDWYRLAIPGV